jgi:hypothetical protein
MGFRLTDWDNVKRKHLILFILGTLLTSFTVACNPASTQTSFEVPRNFQSGVPFQIIVPSYLPNDIKNSVPIFEGPWANSPSVNVTSLQIVFNTGGPTNKSIIIDEQNLPVYGEPIPGDTIFILNNTQIEEGPLYTSGTENLTGSMYTWNSGNLNFIVEIVGYNETESRKILGSMVQ